MNERESDEMMTRGNDNVMNVCGIVVGEWLCWVGLYECWVVGT